MTAPGMVTLVTDYLTLRRGLGFDLVVQGQLLLSFARYAQASGHVGPITIDLAMRWAESSGSGPDQAARRLAVIRQFARHRVAFDPATEIPSADLFRRPRRWKPPHVYSDGETSDLLRAAAALPPPGGLRPHTYVALFSLLVSTGLRVSEARRLTCQDVDLKEGVLVVRETKFRKSRLVPVHVTTTSALSRYTAFRDGCPRAPRSEYFFRTEHAGALKKRTVEGMFSRLSARMGWTANGRARRPRIHDLRHTMVVRRLLRWYAEGADIDRKMLTLATYLGHANVRNTYWYLSAVPELLAVASRRFESFSRSEEEVVR